MLNESLVKILVVDDDPGSLDFVSVNLQMQGYKVVCARDGAEAIEMLAKDAAIDVVVSDIFMPNIDGYELLKHVNETPVKPHFFLMTSDLDQSELDAIDAGADGIFYKPFEVHRFTLKLSILKNKKFK